MINKRIKSIYIKGDKIVVDLHDSSQMIYALSNYKGFTYNNYYFYYRGQKFSERNKTLEDFEEFLNGTGFIPDYRPSKPSVPEGAIQVSNWEEI